MPQKGIYETLNNLIGLLFDKFLAKYYLSQALNHLQKWNHNQFNFFFKVNYNFNDGVILVQYIRSLND